MVSVGMADTGEAEAAPKAPSRDRGARRGSRQDEDQREAQREDQVDGFGEEWRRETEERSRERERRVRSVFRWKCFFSVTRLILLSMRQAETRGDWG